MSGKQVDPEARRQAADAVIAGKKAAEIAADFGITVRAVRNWVKARRAELGAATRPSPTPEPEPEPEKPAGWNAAGHAAALRAMGEETDEPEDGGPDDQERIPVDAHPFNEDEEQEFDRAAAEQEALDTLADLKAELVEGIVAMKFSPPLDVDDPRVQKASKPGPFLRRCVRKNLETIGPMMDMAASSPWALLGALLMDGLFTMRRLKKAAATDGWRPPSKDRPKGEPAAATVDAPPPRGVAPPPPPPPEPQEPGEPGRPRVIDAPMFLPPPAGP